MAEAVTYTTWAEARTRLLDLWRQSLESGQVLVEEMTTPERGTIRYRSYDELRRWIDYVERRAAQEGGDRVTVLTLVPDR